MTTDMITVKLDDKFLDNLDSVVKEEGYQNRTEFIRTALREKLEEIKLKKAMISIAHLKGASKKKTSDKDYEKIRRKAFEEMEEKIKKFVRESKITEKDAIIFGRSVNKGLAKKYKKLNLTKFGK